MKELTLIIPAKEESNSLPKVLEEVQNLELKKLIVLAENDYKTINSIKDKDTGIKYIQMVINMKVIGTKIENKGMVF